VAIKEKRREQILASALEVFAEKGYHASGVADILDHAGISRGTFYLYFESKRQLFDELLDDLLIQVQEVFKPVDLSDPHRTVYQQLRDNCVAILSHLIAQPALARVILAQAPGVDADVDRRLESFYDDVITLLSETLSFGMKVGIVRDLDPQMVAICIVGSVKELIYQHVLRDRAGTDVERLATAALDYNMHGILRSRA
jgi:AcrR family transcriptional regulator